MNISRKLTVALVMLLLVHFAFAQNKKYILANGKAEKEVVVLDYNTLEEITRIPTGADPHEIVTSADGAMAYISNPELKNNGHAIDVINLKTLQHEESIDTRPFYIPHGLVYMDDQLWFTAQGSKTIGVYDLKSKSVTEVLGTGQDFTHLLEVLPNGKTFYATNVESGTVSIYEKKEIPPYMPPTGKLPPNAQPRVEWRQTLIDVGYGAEGFATTPGDQELWTARPDGHVLVIDLIRKEVIADIDTGVEGLHRLKITADGTTACIVSVKTGDLLFYDIESRTLKRQMQMGQGAGLYIDEASNRLFVSCTPNNYIAVVDLKDFRVLKKIEIGRPDGVTSVEVYQE